MISIKVRIRQAGKRRDLFKEANYRVRKDTKNIKELIDQVVRSNVDDYNNQEDIVSFLTREEIEEAGSIGRVSFARKKNKNKQDIGEAVENALVSFEDGLYFIFINEEQKEDINEKVKLKDRDKVIFIKLVMLAGRKW